MYCFADDMKIYMRVYNLDECQKLYSDSNRFVHYFMILDLSLNISKCRIMLFSRNRSPIMCSHHLINYKYLYADDYVIDFGIKLIDFLEPKYHIEN